MRWFDTHCHINQRYEKEGAEPIIRAAREAGVSALTVIGCGPDLADVEEVIALAERYEGVYATAGLHPHEASAFNADYEAALRRFAGNDVVRAIGETGLDYHYDHSPRDEQRAAFEAQVALAREVKKPVVIHNRSSDADCIEVLKSSGIEDVGGVVHCFSSSWELAREALDRGMYLGFTGIVTFKNAEEVREVLRKTPRDRIVIETDSPFLAPVPHRGKRNQPAWVADVGRGVAATLGMSESELAELTFRNACRLYGLSDGA